MKDSKQKLKSTSCQITIVEVIFKWDVIVYQSHYNYMLMIFENPQHKYHSLKPEIKHAGHI